MHKRISIFISIALIGLFLFGCHSDASPKTEEVKEKEVKESKVAKMVKTVAFGTEKLTFLPNEKCKECHPLIYKEFIKSSHNKSTVFEDEIHAAVWNLHPKNLKFQQYSCGKCHTPAADNAADFVTEGIKVLPDANNNTQNQGISCASCHRIASIEQHESSNTMRFSTEKKTYFGTMPNPKDEPYHDIITNNLSFNRGDVCLACHSHNLNKSGLAICAMDIEVTAQKTGDNCMYCHMPQVKGSRSTEVISDTHAFHGFPGTHYGQQTLGKYINLQFGRKDNGFVIIVQNQAPHPMFLQPLRVGKLKVRVLRDGKEIKAFEDQLFVKILGKDGKPTFPWQATEVVKNTILNGKKAITFEFEERNLQKGDKIEITIGYHLVNPKAAPKLKLEKNKEATEFRVIKSVTFTY